MRYASILLLLVAAILSSCHFNKASKGMGEYTIKDIEIYQDTDAWELAQAVKSQNTGKINKIAKENPELLNLQDPKYQTTLLIWAVGMEKYKAAEALLKNGADPNIISGYEGGTALYLAAGYSWVDRNAKKDAKYVKLLLKYGADPNINFVGSEKEMLIPPEESGKDAVYTGVGRSPLMASIPCGIEKTKALVEAGADIDHKDAEGHTAALVAIGYPEYAYYLIAEKKANIKDPYFIHLIDPVAPNYTEYFLVDSLRDWICKLDSEEYKMKMEIVEEFARQGIDYWSTEIPPRKLEQIKKLYPDSWEE